MNEDMTPVDPQAAQRFLLDELPDDERVALERDMLWNRELADALVAAEEALIDEYVHGTMAPQVRSRVERTYLSRPGGRARVALAAATRRVARREPRAAARPRLRAWFPLAAALVLAIGSLLALTVFTRDVRTVALSANLTRDSADVVPVRLALRATHVRLLVELEVDVSPVDVVLYGPASRVVGHWSGVALAGRGPVRHLAVAVETAALPEGGYEVVLRSPGSPPDRRELGFAYFTVTRR
jgi:hypothetical protein